MDKNHLLLSVKAEHPGLFGSELTEESAAALLGAAFRAVREQIQNTEEGLVTIADLGTFRVRRAERGEGEQRVVHKAVAFNSKPAAEPQLARIANRSYVRKGSFARKPEIFIAEYEKLFGAIRREPLRILELGVNRGESLLIWRDYFPNAVIIGVDIHDRPPLLANEPRIHFVQGSQDDPATLDAAAAIGGRPFDIVIDDASHIGYLTKRSLYYLFPRWLRPGGYYVIEDLGAAFWPQFPDGALGAKVPLNDGPQTRIFRSHEHGVVGVVKQVIDLVVKDTTRVSAPVLNVERMTFIAGMAILRKSPAPAAPKPDGLRRPA